MNLKKRYEELVKKHAWARQKLSRAKEALGAGSWHEDSSYELADQDIRVWVDYLSDLEKELVAIEALLTTKKAK